MVDFLVITRSIQPIFILKVFFFYKTTYLNEEVNCTGPSPSVRVPCIKPKSIDYFHGQALSGELLKRPSPLVDLDEIASLVRHGTS